MIPEQRQRIIELIQAGKELSPEWKRVLFPPGKREYELVYDGKERAEEILADTMSAPLQPVRTFGRNGTGWSNMLIFGDNLQVMKTLLEMKRKGNFSNPDGTPGIRLAYIDPPFATKRDFKGTQDQKAYQDKIAGAAFCEFLRRRLVFLRELLAEDGSLILHLDSKRVHYVKVLLDEIFGEHRFVNEIIWRSTVFTGSSKAIAKRFPANHQTLLWYRGHSGYVFNKPREDYKPEYLERFRNPDNDPRGPWQSVSLKTYSKKRFAELKHEGRIIPPKRKGAGWRYKFYLSETKGKVIESLWLDETMANSMAEERTDYPTQKPEALLARVVSTFSNPGDLVLDAFAGSGTTCAVAEKLGRRWVGIDCGKLALYTMQKRLLNLRPDIGNKKGRQLKPKPFTLYNAGLYDFSRLRELPWEGWRFFALQLFQCKDQPHRIGGIELDGTFKGADVLVFNHYVTPGARVTYETIDDIHEAIGKKVGRRFFIIAPALSFSFQEDYVDRNGTRYYALLIPYSIIHELHRRDFTAIRQPADEAEVNDTVESVGFDFIRTPSAKVSYRVRKPKGSLFKNLTIRVTTFRSEAVTPGAEELGNLDSLSMLLLDVDYNGEVFDLDHSFFRDQLKEKKYAVDIPIDSIKDRIMLVLLDIYGNEFREVKTAEELGIKKAPSKSEPKPKKKTTKKRTSRSRSHAKTSKR
jgi:site-specific DNA-methyltransferase (adenine-specific)/adenine-specific DNA-methyltransferase